MSEEPAERQEPETEERRIEDKAGRSYRLTVAEARDLWVFKLFDERTLVGQANCLLRTEDLLLADLRIEEEAKGRKKGLSALLQFASSPHNNPVSYRGRGLGRALLIFIIRRATERGLRQISGNLFPQDLKTNPKLPDWYRQFGFEVTMNNDISGSIRLQLPRPALKPEGTGLP